MAKKTSKVLEAFEISNGEELRVRHSGGKLLVERRKLFDAVRTIADIYCIGDATQEKVLIPVKYDKNGDFTIADLKDLELTSKRRATMTEVSIDEFVFECRLYHINYE